jgi:hypothetical protein
MFAMYTIALDQVDGTRLDVRYRSLSLSPRPANSYLVKWQKVYGIVPFEYQRPHSRVPRETRRVFAIIIQ